MAIKTFFNGMRRMWSGTESTFNEVIMPTLIDGKAHFNINNADSVSTVYICVKTLADTISRLPLNVYVEDDKGRVIDKTDYRYPLLHYNPNSYTSQQTFIAALEYFRNFRGNSFALIHRDSFDARVLSLELIAPSRVHEYGIEEGELFYKIKFEDNSLRTIHSSDVLHFRTITKDGIWGINPIEALRLNVSSTWQGLQTIDSFYRNNATTPKAIKSTVGGANHKSMLEALNDFQAKYAGALNAGKMIPLPPNTDIVDMSLSFADAMFIDTLKFNAGQIAAMYGVPPSSVGLFEASKFNNVEQMGLEFKSQTLASIARMYRQEFEFKLLTTNERLAGKTIEFNMMALVETDSKTRIDNQLALMKNGIITPNDVAAQEGYSTFPEGDKHYMLGAYMPIEDRKFEQLQFKKDTDKDI